MPLRNVTISRFDGMAGGADARDLPPSVGAFSRNVDPLSQEGKLQGVPARTLFLTGGGGRSYALGRDGTEALFASGSGAATVIRHAETLTGTPAVSTIHDPVDSPAETDGEVCIQSDGQAWHIGMGAGSAYLPKWLGLIAHGQFAGAAPSGLQVADAELRRPVMDGLNTEVEIAGTPAATATTGAFQDGFSYIYRTSYIYDGFQEGPLSQQYDSVTVSGGNSPSISIDVTAVPANIPSARISAIAVYRSETAHGASVSLESETTLVTIIPIDDAGWTLSGTDYVYTFTDKYDIGASYDARTEVAPTLDHFAVHYGLSCVADGHHFVARCYSPEFEAANYLFRSKPYRFDTFDWSQDYLQLPVEPVAMAFYAGRLFAFTEGRTFVINPQTLSVTEEWEGIGCMSAESVVVSDRGMFWASRRGIFLYDGRSVENVGLPVLQNEYAPETSLGTAIDVSWLELTHEESPSCLYDAERDAFVAAFSTANPDGGTFTGAYLFSMLKGRIDFMDLSESGSLGGRLQGPRGECLIADGADLYSLFTGSRSAWEWASRKLTASPNDRSGDTLWAKFYKARIFGSVASLTYSRDEGAFASGTLSADGTGVVTASLDASPWTRARSMQIVLSGAGSDEVDSVGVVMRSLGER